MECEKNLKKLVNILSKEEITVIFEIGARDCKETIAFNHFFPNSKIYTYECNPNTIEICKKNVTELDNVILTEKAVSNQSGEITFYPINQEKTESSWKDGNPGASSIFKAKNDNY
jgi:FkbM family methyltransferase